MPTRTTSDYRAALSVRPRRSVQDKDSFKSVAALGVLALGLVQKAHVIHHGAVTERALVLTRRLAVGHQDVPLLGAADRRRRLGGTVGDLGQPLRDVVEQAGRLGVGRVAVCVAVFLFDISAQFPTLPLL